MNNKRADSRVFLYIIVLYAMTKTLIELFVLCICNRITKYN